MKIRTILLILALLSVIPIATGGYIYYSVLKESALKQAHREAIIQTKTVANRIASNMAEHQKTVRALAGLDQLQQALEHKDANKIKKVNRVLDNFHQALSSDVCYLMDKQGNTIASSNRNEPDSFVGKNYAFRPYFQKAIQGEPFIYMALGVTSGKRGVYLSHPVYGELNDLPSGVLVVKSSIDDIDQELKQNQNNEGVMLLTDPHGVIFASSRENWLFNVLWRVSPDEIAKIAKSQQFGKGPWNWTGVERETEHLAIDKSGIEYHVRQLENKNHPGWKVIYLHDSRSVIKRISDPLFKTAGLTTLILCVVIGLAVFFLYRAANKDIVLRKKAEEALRESEEKYRELVEGTDDLITRVDSEGRLIYVNHVAEKIFGISMDRCIGMSAFDFVHPDDMEHTQKWFNHIIAMHKTRGTIENRQVNKITGEIYDILWVSNFLYDEESNLIGVNSIARDLTKYKKLKDELFKAKKLESIGILSGGIAHDFNNLLYIIMGNISMTKNDVKPECGVTDFLNAAEEASLKARELANQLITFSTGGAPVKKTGPIGDLVKETTNLSLRGSNVKSEFLFSDNLRLVEFDEGQMKHAVKNIIDNAVESMPDGGSIIVKAENFNITTERDLPFSEGNYVKVSVQDHGVGIPEEHLSKIFDPYFSTKEMGTQKGMGLGLATTYSIISKHDGHITVESEVSVGTTFTIYLPAAVEEIVDIKPVKMVEPEKPAVRTGRILVMDDEEAIRRLSKQVLSRLGYEPGLAKDGAEAIKLFKESIDSGKPFDAVILDLTIKGGMGGKDAVKTLLELDPQVKAIVSSGYSRDPVMTNHRAYGFIGALLKPYSVRDLKDMLNKILGKS